MSRNLEDMLNSDFLNASVTITVQEMCEIISHQMHEVCDTPFEDESDEDASVREAVRVLLGEFGASVMTEMFSCTAGVDDLEIVPGDE